ncbi:LysR family transcriptional regulator [Roseibium sp.]|uniref:LysR family transcriptional regulator n=1 Tax=Roseibium sp. TaxID=1936156 RepID=UPI003BABDCAA
MLDDIALFVHVAQARSLTGAGTALGLPAATVTRRLQRLEDKLGHQLVHRSARKFALTSEGEAYFQAFAGIVEQAEVTARNLSAEMHELSGPLVVAAPTNISVGALQPMWTAFMRQYPGIRLDLRLSNFNIDLLDERIDLALRIGPQQDQRLYQRKIGSISTAVMAAPSYLKGGNMPESPDDLEQHAIIAVRTIPAWRLSHRLTGSTSELHLKGDVIVDDIALVRQFAEDGFGVCLLSVTEAAEPLEQGRLKLLLPDWQGQQRDIYAVWPTGRLLSARAKCLREFMRTYLAERPVFQGQLPAVSTLT